MTREAGAAGAEAVVISTSLEDEAASIGRILAGLAAESVLRGRPFPCPGVLIGCGGEATVRLGPSDEFGLGGPNEEAALAAAGCIEGLPIAAVFLDTDGSDGGSELAGGICDGETVTRARATDIDLRRALATHRSGEALTELGDAIVTGPTHTNVNDLFVIAIGEAPTL
jgi:glycerate-2-kinase